MDIQIARADADEHREERMLSGMVVRPIGTAILGEVLFGDIVKTGLLAVTLVLLGSICGAAQRVTGSVCVAAS